MIEIAKLKIDRVAVIKPCRYEDTSGAMRDARPHTRKEKDGTVTHTTLVVGQDITLQTARLLVASNRCAVLLRTNERPEEVKKK